MGKTSFNKSQTKEGIWFGLIVIAQLIFFAYFIIGRRLLYQHDTFHLFSLQYYFLNHAVIYGSIPQWIPFLTHGIVANGFYALQAGLLQNVLIAIGPVLKPFNFFNIFYIEMFVDELLLLTGSWLLAKRYFKSIYTVFFVCISIIGSTIWALQPWFNFKFYYAFPLILVLFHYFLDTGRWRYFFLAVNLIAIQTLGNLAYLLPFTTIAVTMYLLFHFLLNRDEVLKQFGQVKLNGSLVIPVIWVCVSFLVAYAILKIGTDQILYYGHLRNRDGSASLKSFLDVRPNMGRFGVLEFMFGMIPFNDYTMYIGVVAAYMALIALITKWSRQKSVIILFIAFVLLFCGGTIISIFFYHAWPMMKYFRHIELTLGFCKLFMCFLAGFGFELLFVEQKVSESGKKILAVIVLTALLIFTLLMTNQALGRQCLGFFNFEPGLIDFLFRKFETRCFWIFATTLPFAFALLLKSGKRTAVLLGAILLIHVFDLAAYKWTSFQVECRKLSVPQYKLLEFTEMPFIRSRKHGYSDREIIYGDVKEFFETKNARYWTLFAFIFQDSFNSERQTDQWLIPLDQLIKAYWKQPIYDTELPPIDGFSEIDHKLILPDHPALKKIGALDEDKIQFFSDAHILNSSDAVADSITSPEFQGDLLFVTPPGNNIAGAEHVLKPLGSSERLNLSYEVTHFDSNQIKLSVDVPGDKSAWVFYSDVWSPFWKATVNGNPRQVFKANMAYKAVQIEPGKNEIRFYFDSKWISFLHIFLIAHSAFWLCVLFFLVGKICITEEKWKFRRLYNLI